MSDIVERLQKHHKTLTGFNWCDDPSITSVYSEAAAEITRLRSRIEEMEKPTTDETMGMAWWNNLTEEERRIWMRRSGSARPADAWALFKAS